MFEGMPGLRLKVFTFDEKQQRVANLHVWDSREAAETTLDQINGFLNGQTAGWLAWQGRPPWRHVGQPTGARWP
jgi:hypothetical protein